MNKQLRPARTSRRRPNAKLLVVSEPGANIFHQRLTQLPDLFQPGDLLVFNNAATIPASFQIQGDDETIEMRLLSNLSHDMYSPRHFLAVFYRGGDWRDLTEDRLAFLPHFSNLKLHGVPVKIMPSKIHPLIAKIEFLGSDEAIWDAIYARGRPIQYSHLREGLEIWDQQTVFSTRPLALEPPSAAIHFNWQLLGDLKRRGVKFAQVMHASGVSSTGISEVDAALPFPERFEIPPSTAKKIAEAKRAGHKVIAVGTSATRALESAVDDRGHVSAGRGLARLKLGPFSKLRVVEGLITGLHETGSSHLELLKAFGRPDTIDRAYAEAASFGYRYHEFGDLNIILQAA